MSACRKTRREFIWETGCGFTGLALLDLLSEDGFFAKKANASGPKQKAKSVIFLYMYGGPSQVDTFDYKPSLFNLDGKTINIKSFRNNNQMTPLTISAPKWKFKQYGQSGQWVSDLFPNIGSCIDDICLLKSVVAESPIHGSAMLQMNTGKILSGSPSIGSWLNYGLGSENKNLPGFMVMLDPSGGPINGAKNWSSGYMPATYQGTVLRSGEKPILNLNRPENISQESQKDVLNAIQDFNKEHFSKRADNSNLSARIKAYEMAYQMQTSAPEAVDLSKEPKYIRELYGLDDPSTSDFGSRCLLARRMVERGVRYIQLYSGGSNTDFMNFWDAHGGIIANHNHLAGKVDKPIAGLIKDLKQRGLLDSTLIVWGGEFGRTPHSTGDGRDHHASCFSMWMAGGGIKGGISYGESDETGHEVGKDPVSIKQLHATILNQMGVDPNKLSYYYGGLDQKLVGVEYTEPILTIRK